MKFQHIHNDPIWLQALQEFEAEAYFECHESLEQLWMQADGDEKLLLQSLIQVTVAYHHWHQGNFKGATSILKRAHKKLNLDLKGWPLEAQRQAVDMALAALEKKQELQPPPWRHDWSQLSTDPVEPSSELC